MAATQPPAFVAAPPVADAPALHQRAMDNLEFIRDTMARAATVTLPLSGVTSLLKARRTARARGTPVFTASGRRLLLSFLPPFTVIATGGAFSVRPVPFMGLTFLALGALALCGDLLGPETSAVTLDLPRAWGNACMGLGFGLVHLGFGAYIARRYGG